MSGLPNTTDPKHIPSSADDVRNAEQVLNDASAAVAARTRPESSLSKAAETVNSVSSGAGESGGAELLMSSVNTLLEGLPSLVKALDEVSKIHPFVGSECLYSYRWLLRGC